MTFIQSIKTKLETGRQLQSAQQYGRLKGFFYKLNFVRSDKKLRNRKGAISKHCQKYLS